MDLRQKKTIYYFGVALAIVVATAAFLRLSYEAKAADVEDMVVGAGGHYGSPDIASIGSKFVPEHFNISKISVLFLQNASNTGPCTWDSWGTSTMKVYDVNYTLLASSTVVSDHYCEENGWYIDYTFTPIHVTASTTYFWTIDQACGTLADCGNDFTIKSHVDSGYDWYLIPTIADDINPSGSISAYYYYDNTSYDYPPVGTTSVFIVDDPELYEDNVWISPTMQTACSWQTTTTPCTISYWFNPASVGKQIYLLGEENNLPSTFIASDTIALGDFNKNEFTVPSSEVPTSSQVMEYCMRVYSDFNNQMTVCGVQLYWLTDAVGAALVEAKYPVPDELSTSTCQSMCTTATSTGWFTDVAHDISCGIQTAICGLFIASPTEIRTLQQQNEAKLRTNSTYQTFQRLTDQMQMTSLVYDDYASSSNYKSIKLPLYWNGQETGFYIFDTQAIRNSGLKSTLDYVYTSIDYILWFIVVLYIMRRLVRIAGGDLFEESGAGTVAIAKGMRGERTIHKSIQNRTPGRYKVNVRVIK